MSPTQRPLHDNRRHSQEWDIHDLGRIRTHNPSIRAAADPRLRPRGHWDRHFRSLRMFHISHTFYAILYIFTILNYLHTKHFVLCNTISLCKRGRPFPSCDVEFLNSCFYRAWWLLHMSKPGRSVIFNEAKKSVGCDWSVSEDLKTIPCLGLFYYWLSFIKV
jgi:hypothetical protein